MNLKFTELLFGKPKTSPDYPGIKFADFGVRLLASTVDVLLLFVMLVDPIPIMPVLGDFIYGDVNLQQMTDEANAQASIGEVIGVIFTYPGFLPRLILFYIVNVSVMLGLVYFFWVKYAATPGKMLLRLKIVDAATMQPASAFQYGLRAVGYLISCLFLCLGFIWISFDRRAQGWHDKIARTVVVYRSSFDKEELTRDSQSADPSMPPAPESRE